LGVSRIVVVVFALDRPSPSGALEGGAQHELDLAVQAAQIIIGPTLHRVEYVTVNAQQKRLAFSHDAARSVCS